MNNKKKKYVGSFANERDAAILYDKVAILTHGLKVSPLLTKFVIQIGFRQKQTLGITKTTY